jgi:hypothetical protein
MVDDSGDELGSPRPLSARTIVIFFVSSAVAVCAAGGLEVGIGRVLGGMGGAAIPTLAGLVSAGPVFYFCAEVLRRHIR